MRTLIALSACLLFLACPAAGAGPVDYARDIKPILARHCYACHGPKKQKSGFRLDSAAAALEGGDSGPAIVPSKSGRSRLIQAVSGAGDVPVMPPRGPRLSAGQIALLRAWIDQGAKAPPEETAVVATPKSKHWSFQPVKRPRVPKVKKADWPRNPIDRFILARLEKEDIAPSPEADRTTLIRRLSLDLLGLPPAPREVADFLADHRPDAYERLVDRLLASSHYGERWGRHWLDLARYADSNGFNIDDPRTIWLYRDWVINALNKDLPFDQFTVEQIAGDLLLGATVEQKIATGFHRNTLRNQEGGIDVEQFRVESVVDRVNTTGAVFLGLTVGCAQCHNHKFDPISQREFYRLFAFLNNSDEPTLAVGTSEQVARHAALLAQLATVTRELDAYVEGLYPKQLAWEKDLSAESRNKLAPKIQAILKVPLARRSDSQQNSLRLAFLATDIGYQERQRTVAQLRARLPKVPTTLVMKERAQPRATYIHLGGDFLRKGARLSPGVPAVLHPLPAPPKPPTRLDLATGSSIAITR